MAKKCPIFARRKQTKFCLSQLRKKCVEFHNGEEEVIIEGGSQILLSTLIAELGLTRNDGETPFTVDEVASVEFKNPNLFSQEEVFFGDEITLNEGKETEETVTIETEHDFVLTSEQPFDADQMIITLKDGEVIGVEVTDESSVSIPEGMVSIPATNGLTGNPVYIEFVDSDGVQSTSAVTASNYRFMVIVSGVTDESGNEIEPFVAVDQLTASIPKGIEVGKNQEQKHNGSKFLNVYGTEFVYTGDTYSDRHFANSTVHFAIINSITGDSGVDINDLVTDLKNGTQDHYSIFGAGTYINEDYKIISITPYPTENKITVVMPTITAQGIPHAPPATAPPERTFPPG